MLFWKSLRSVAKERRLLELINFYHYLLKVSFVTAFKLFKIHYQRKEAKMKYDCINSMLVDTIASIAKQMQDDCRTMNNSIRTEEYKYYLQAVQEELEIISTLADMALKEYPKPKEGGEE